MLLLTFKENEGCTITIDGREMALRVLSTKFTEHGGKYSKQVVIGFYADKDIGIGRLNVDAMNQYSSEKGLA